MRAPEAVELLLRGMSRTRPLRREEIVAAQSVLGAYAIDWGAVRVATGGWLRAAFALNGDRAFATFHTIHLPSRHANGIGNGNGNGNEDLRRCSLALMVHELTHVYQYERVGSVYIPQALHAQATDGYDYGGGFGLVTARRAGRRFSDFNREQQAQIAEDYYRLVVEGGGCLSRLERRAYDAFIDELQTGEV